MSFKAWISFLALTLIHQVVASSSTQIPKSIVIGVDGGTESIRACCFNAETGHIVGTSCAVAYSTRHPQPGWAEQSPADWWRCLGEAVRGAVATLDSEIPRIEAICLDTTCCSVVALDDALEPLRPSLLWMDQRSASQCLEILELAKGDPALNVNSGGMGPLSAEWMIPKALWLKQIEPETYTRARYICEYQDYLNYKLTGIICASSCNAAVRWHWDGVECVNEGKGRPLSLYQKLGMPELVEKLPSKCFAMGEKIGPLSKEAADHLKLQPNIPIIQGGPDAFVGMIGNGCVTPGQMCLITGSSHLHCVVSSEPFTSVGIWGAYKGAPLSHLNFAEGGQSSTGSILRWAKNTLFGGADLSYKDLDDAAAIISPGCDGLVALETFQGSRTPVTDPLARGALIGLTLSHTQAHVWRAFLEAVCFGTRACIEGLEQAGHSCQEIIMAGGSTRSPLWLQLHADITGKPVLVCENSDAPLLGCAILAAVGAGIYESVDAAVAKMVRIQKRVDPNPDSATIYDNLYKNVYAKVGGASQPVVHAIARFRGGALVSKEPELLEQTIEDISTIISPSILACNWAYMARDIQRCVDAGVTRLHVDVFDGVFLDSPHAFSFGPKMVRDIRSSFPDVELDIHLCVDRPERYVQPMEDAGASRILVPWEATDRAEGAFRLAEAVVAAGMAFGISLNPETPLEEIFPLLESGMVDTVNILAVNPGFGGQLFQNRVLDKVQRLVSWREKHHFKIMIDGGITPMTATLAKNAGSDILVAGTFIFHHDLGVLAGIKDLLDTE